MKARMVVHCSNGEGGGAGGRGRVCLLLCSFLPIVLRSFSPFCFHLTILSFATAASLPYEL